MTDIVRAGTGFSPILWRVACPVCGARTESISEQRVEPQPGSPNVAPGDIYLECPSGHVYDGDRKVIERVQATRPPRRG